MVDLELDFYRCFCSTSKFIINGVVADIEDFGHQEDMGRYDDDREDYCCKNMQFIIKRYGEDIREKYNITEEEYYDIAFKLKDNLSFGYCILCS